MQELRTEYDAPIKYSKANDGYYYDEGFILDITPDRRFNKVIKDIGAVILNCSEDKLKLELTKIINKFEL